MPQDPTSSPSTCTRGPEITTTTLTFEDSTVALNLTGSRDLAKRFQEEPRRGWGYDNKVFCAGFQSVTAGGNFNDLKGVEDETIFRVKVPAGAASMSWF